jgi:hypothetical protein
MTLTRQSVVNVSQVSPVELLATSPQYLVNFLFPPILTFMTRYERYGGCRLTRSANEVAECVARREDALTYPVGQSHMTLGH